MTPSTPKRKVRMQKAPPPSRIRVSFYSDGNKWHTPWFPEPGPLGTFMHFTENPKRKSK